MKNSSRKVNEWSLHRVQVNCTLFTNCVKFQVEKHQFATSTKKAIFMDGFYDYACKLLMPLSGFEVSPVTYGVFIRSKSELIINTSITPNSLCREFIKVEHSRTHCKVLIISLRQVWFFCQQNTIARQSIPPLVDINHGQTTTTKKGNNNA